MRIKSELIEAVSRSLHHLTEKEVALGVNHIIDKICAALVDRDRIEIRGFGTFSLHFRPSRLAHNPKTGEKLMTPPRYAVHFKPGKELREKVNATMGQPILADSQRGADNEEDFE